VLSSFVDANLVLPWAALFGVLMIAREISTRLAD
jgi:hypothetical protein